MIFFFFFFQAEDGIRDVAVTGVQTCALPISPATLGTAHTGEVRKHTFDAAQPKGTLRYKPTDNLTFYGGSRRGGSISGAHPTRRGGGGCAPRPPGGPHLFYAHWRAGTSGGGKSGCLLPRPNRTRG